MTEKNKKNPWLWVPPLYFTEGLPYIIINTVSVIMYKRLDISNADIGLYTSWLYLPWVVKPLWSPIVELKSSKRNWFLTMQLLGAISFLMVGVSLNFSAFFLTSLLFFWMGAIWSATHDIAADGFYMMALGEKQQSFFIGIRSTFYRIAVIAGQGGIVILAGLLETSTGNNAQSWSWAMIIVGLILALLMLANMILTPKIRETKAASTGWSGFVEVFISFFKKKNIVIGLAYILLYRLGESQLVKMASPFLLDKPEDGGVGLSTTEVGTVYGTIGLIALSVGGILGGYLISKDGLGKWIWKMAFALNIPNVFYALLAFLGVQSVEWVTMVVVIEQFGYGFGFTAFLMYTIYLAEGVSKTSHYAIATGFMALGMMLPGMISGFVQEYLGYAGFFTWVAIAGIPGLFLIQYLKFPYEYGKK
ncbi:MAG: MFS transporter [Cyclobacteriaceae bacterium]|nr:MFS transporter [Cyclobacteriaceae bacterium HetDA_MAG_MS6]